MANSISRGCPWPEDRQPDHVVDCSKCNEPLPLDPWWVAFAVACTTSDAPREVVK